MDYDRASALRLDALDRAIQSGTAVNRPETTAEVLERATAFEKFLSGGDEAVPQSASGPIPSVGRIVILTLSELQADQVNAARAGTSTLGNAAHAGDEVPLVIVRVNQFPSSVNGQALLDGNDSLWVTSIAKGHPGEPGRWAWPDRR